ncbi:MULTISPECIES: 4-hydroxythreonine-4-phosphate dehydrogenase PdxA [unclassified Coleofasciculus]|uniref:4-hydroxythreonine-4-phosphate dehydrogenase PdxA n=1 Tax=unclassified Coleofasciculus TaxID=2692782 RepID=UPI001880CC4E|nr:MULTISPECIES: 4-hydroxythreonine-4-phosphate dehydrogenase PdxA [unclassified Coleofasciculus]MBE9126293.1 4-hydroxythreonine-4-phosphate dehydrogenase PdxA [Coleofasciculus sp. LEGE 07081]MBE9149212.1 4-hydroxythreonine-4-phosphate dehydrogenase PdxA [Coleofasciculus sp. LEGE 07092]
MKTRKTLFTEPFSRRQGRPRLAVTLGDPAGIGPEVVLKALADPEITQDADITVIGSQWLLDATYSHLRQTVDAEVLAKPDRLSVLDVELEASERGQITPGAGSAVSGGASFAYLERAIAQTLAGEFDGIVTAPIAKSLWKAAGYDYPGQTEVLAKYAGVERFGMLFVARSPHTDWLLRTLLATTHIPLRQVPDTLTPELMTAKLDLLVECLRLDFGIETPRIAISGLNPHSGEQGQLGVEEQNWLIPWLEQERQHRSGLQLDGVVPPDTLWVKPGQAWYGIDSSQAHDGYLALYHDQGLIPVKLMAFDRAVNTTIGLPFVRTSPDHGTAFDIAGQGVANATSMKAAIQLGAELVNQRLSCQS